MKQFSATEKAVFGFLLIIALISAIWMAGVINSSFMTKVPAFGGHLREGVIGLPRTINPVLAVTDVDRDIASLVYSGLMRYKDGEIVPDLAESYKISSDGLTYSFKLKDDAKFQDGTLLTTEDVAFTVQKIQDAALKSPRRADWANVSVKVISPLEIEFTLKQPYSPFLGNTTVGILPKHIWKDVSGDQFIFSQYNIEPIGSGPYKESGMARDNGGIPVSYTLSAWRGYMSEKPFIKNITFYFFSDEEKALAALESNAIDSLPSVSSSDAKMLASNTGERYSIASVPLPRIFGIFFNQSQNPVLGDKNVRIALEMAVDRKAIIESALSGYGTAITGPLPFGMTSSTSTAPSANIEKAQALLEKNGWKIDPASGVYQKKSKTSVQNLTFDIYTADTSDLKLAAEIIKQSWAKLGAKVNIKVFEPSDLYQNIIRTRKYDALLFGEFIGKDRDLYAFWHSSQRNAPGLNISMYVNSKADKLLEDIRSTNDEKLRRAKYAQFEQVIEDDVPAIFLYSPDFIYAVPKNLEGMDLSSITIPSDRWNSVSEWYITTENVWNIFGNKTQTIKK